MRPRPGQNFWGPMKLRRLRDDGFRDVEPGIRDAVRFLAQEGHTPVLSCQGHRGYQWWAMASMRRIAGRPWILVASGQGPSHGLRAVLDLLVEGYGPLACRMVALKDTLEARCTRQIRAVQPSKYHVLIVFASRRAAQARPAPGAGRGAE